MPKAPDRARFLFISRAEAAPVEDAAPPALDVGLPLVVPLLRAPLPVVPGVTVEFGETLAWADLALVVNLSRVLPEALHND